MAAAEGTTYSDQELRRVYPDILEFSTEHGAFFSVYMEWKFLTDTYQRALDRNTSPENPLKLRFGLMDETYLISSADTFRQILREQHDFFNGVAYTQITERHQTTPFETRWFTDERDFIQAIAPEHAQQDTEALDVRYEIGGEKYRFYLDLFIDAPMCDPDCNDCRAYASLREMKSTIIRLNT